MPTEELLQVEPRLFRNDGPRWIAGDGIRVYLSCQRMPGPVCRTIVGSICTTTIIALEIRLVYRDGVSLIFAEIVGSKCVAASPDRGPELDESEGVEQAGRDRRRRMNYQDQSAIPDAKLGSERLQSPGSVMGE